MKNIQIFFRFENNHDDYSSIMVKAIADRLAEVPKCRTILIRLRF